MKRTISLLLSLFTLVSFQFSYAATNTDPAVLAQPYSTPELTWSLFKESILKNDFDTAKKCCREGKADGVLKYKKMDTEKRKSIVQSMQELEKIQLQENSAKYKLIRSANGKSFSTFVYFQKIHNEWKIDNF
ncbi:hypothetical protein ACFLYW_02670 [Thermodesulfobacteriota bacterium]